MPKKGISKANHKRTYPPETIKAAAVLYYQGLSITAVAEELGIAVSTISRWKTEDKFWREQWRELESIARQQRENLIETQAEMLDATSSRLGEFSLVNLNAAIELQEKAMTTIEGLTFPENPKGFDDCLALIKCLESLTRMVDSSWQNYVLAMNLQDYLQQNQTAAPEIHFEEYSDAEIEEIRQQA